MSQDKVRLAEAIKAEARGLGFDLAGVTTPDPPPHYPVFTAWLEAGRHGEMGYLANERSRLRRSDPHEILPEVRSILVLGVRYPSPVSDASRQKGVEDEAGAVETKQYTGKIAAYAWADDYHDVLPERLKALVAFIEAAVGHPVPNRWYTDTGPVLERDLAQRAGLGWIGKNTCLINPQQGSYFLLAEILLGIDLEPDLPVVTDHCGTCTRCLEACPTGCILPDRTLDARRCLSYLTIELKGAIPEDLRPALGEWVFGCDICQQVCPWNQRFAQPEGDPAFSPRPDVPRPDLIRDLQEITPEVFNRRFKGSPVKRAKRRGYLRNVAVSLGSQAAGSQDSEVVAALAAALHDGEPLVRRHTAWALGQVGGEAARRHLAAALSAEQAPEVRDEISAALGTIGS